MPLESLDAAGAVPRAVHLAARGVQGAPSRSNVSKQCRGGGIRCTLGHVGACKAKGGGVDRLVSVDVADATPKRACLVTRRVREAHGHCIG